MISRKEARILTDSDRCFSPNTAQRRVAHELYSNIANLPLICPHGHVDPRLFANPEMRFGSPTELFILPDHYLLRMLFSQGISLESLGVPRRDGSPVETDHRAIWRRFAQNFFLFRGTPSGLWINEELGGVFGITEKLTAHNADTIYDQIVEALQSPDFTPRRLYERFNISVLATTDAASDTLEHHRAIRESGWAGRVIPTFRPDAAFDLHNLGWRSEIERLSAASGMNITDYRTFITALEQRRRTFKELGATATDHGALTALTERLSDAEAETLFQRALKGEATADDTARFTSHMLMEMARMSIEDGLVMQLHVGAFRDHHTALLEQFGADKGADIPTQIEFTRALRPLLNAYGAHPAFTLILFTLDESTYTRELAPLAGYYPAVRLGPPWWFHDSLNGMARYFDRVIETAGLYNTVGFNDDTRAFLSIPARHDLWRRASADWLAGLVVRGLVDEADAAAMAVSLAMLLARKAYRL